MNMPQQKRGIALVVGVNAAPNARTSALTQELKAANDAEQMAQVLVEQCGFELLQPPLLGAEATSGNVKSALINLAAQRTGDDFLLFYFSGHGHLISNIIDGQNDVYLVTHNFTEREVKADKEMHLSMRWLQTQLYHSPLAGKVLLILDCCYAGEMGRTAPDPYLEDLEMRLRQYFGAPGAASGSHPKGLRLALTATGHMQLAHDKGNHGLMTGFLLKALRGEIDEVIDLNEHGSVPLTYIQTYLQRVMPKMQKPSVSGDYAGQECILAQYEQRASELLKRPRREKRPNSYLPFKHNPYFQLRPDELDGLAKVPKLLFGDEGENRPDRPHIVGLVGMGGIGKTSLSIELALHCLQQKRFSAGIFWMPASAPDLAGWQRQLAALAFHARYLPPHDHPGQLENEERRAQYFCHYLLHHPNALLILDNVVNPELIQSVFLQITGRELACTILYTSRDQTTPHDASTYEVKKLTEENALHLLLAKRPKLLAAVKNKQNKSKIAEDESEVAAARNICRSVDYLPLALEQLRALLEQDPQMHIPYLQEELTRQGELNIIEILNKAFSMSWELLNNEKEKQLFMLTACLPEAMPIPLWLLGLATGLGEDVSIISPLGKAVRHLTQASMLEALSNDQVRQHLLLRKFGHKLMDSQQQGGKVALLAEVGQHLIEEFTNANRLEARVRRREGYWGCLGQVREARNFLQQLAMSQAASSLKQIEKWLDRESSELAHGTWWPERLPGLFYQRMYNRAFEENTAIAGTPPAPWLRIEAPSGADDHTLVRVLVDHTDGIKTAAFSPDGHRVLTGSYDQTARLWDSEDGKLLLIIRGHTGSVNSVAFSPDGKRIATGSDDNTVHIWDSEDGKLLLILHGHTERVNSVAFSPDGKNILTGSADKTTRLWDSTNGTCELRLPERTSGIQCMAFSAQKPWILTAGHHTARIWNRQKWEVELDLDKTVVDGNGLVFSYDGQRLVVATSHDTASIVDCETQQVVALLKGHTDWVNCAAISHDGRFVLTGSEDNTVRLWESATGKLLLALTNHTSRVNAVAFSNDGRRILSGSADRTARIWEYDSEILLAQAQSNNTYNMRDTPISTNDSAWHNIRRLEEGRAWVSRAAFSQHGERLVTGNSYSSSARIWDTTQSKILLAVDGRTSGVTSVAISPDGQRVFTGSRDKMARVWDSSSGEQLLEWSCDYDATNATFSPDGQRILTNMGPQAAIWDSTNGKLLFTLDGHTNKVRNVTFSSDGNWILTGSDDKTARIWDAQTGTPLQILQDHHSPVRAILFTPDSQHVFTTDEDQKLRLWERHGGKQLKTFPLEIDIVHTLAISDDSAFLAACDTYGRLLLLRGKEPGQGNVIGLYAAPHEIRAVYWPTHNSLLLVDRERMHDRLHFYRIKLEGMGNF